MSVHIKRIYEAPSSDDGERILIDRLWPRGLSKEKAQVHHWMKSVAPSAELRKWFNHEPEKWTEFSRRYTAELRKNKGDIQTLKAYQRKGRLTLLYAAKDTRHNNAVVLKRLLEQ